MFPNTVNHKEQFGWIEVICGSMFSVKEVNPSFEKSAIAKQK
jgi:thymidine kinase